MSFEEMVWLFNCGKESRGLIRISLDEAALLYKTIKAKEKPKVLEIGRYKGGSTLLIALANSVVLDSVDIKPQDDKYIEQKLKEFGNGSHVNLLVGDASKIDIENGAYDVVFVDGDHSYEGIKKDYLIAKKAAKVGADLLFHDFGRSQEGVLKLLQEVREKDKELKWIETVNTLAHFKKVLEK